jgi:predicted nuclease of predicted toxin-antitoxin system
MKFFLDENFPRSAITVLRECGHEVIDARELLPAGSADALLFDKACELGAVLLSTDRDFFHTLSLGSSTHPGIVVIALRQPNRERILTRLQWFLDSVPQTEISGHAYQLRDTTYIVRSPA